MKTQCLNENASVVSIPGDLLARWLSFHKLGICSLQRENDGIIRMMFVDTSKPFTALLPFTFLLPIPFCSQHALGELELHAKLGMSAQAISQ